MTWGGDVSSNRKYVVAKVEQLEVTSGCSASRFFDQNHHLARIRRESRRFSGDSHSTFSMYIMPVCSLFSLPSKKMRAEMRILTI